MSNVVVLVQESSGTSIIRDLPLKYDPLSHRLSKSLKVIGTDTNLWLPLRISVPQQQWAHIVPFPR